MRGESVGQAIRRLRLALGRSQAQLAADICRAAKLPADRLTRQDVYRWESGRRRPQQWLAHIARALGVPVSTLDGTVRTLDELLPASDRLSAAAARGGRVGTETAKDLLARVHGLRLADDVLAGRDLIAPARRELDRAVSLYKGASYSEPVGHRLLVGIGEAAQITGWIQSDAGCHADAEGTYQLGASAAREAGDTVLAGQLMGSLAYQLSNTRREGEGVALAEAALAESGPDSPAKARALFHDRVAWARAKSGDAPAAIKALGCAAQALDGDRGAEAPPWLYWVSADELEVMEARCFTELHRPLRAVPLLSAVLARYDASHARELALYLSWLAVALADANEPEAAASTAARMLAVSADVASERTAARRSEVLSRLAEYVGVPEVDELLGAGHRDQHERPYEP